jgi:hypothetical protein
VDAIVYRHFDGYPEVAGKELIGFLATCRDDLGRDSRLGDPSCLAAKYVMFLATQQHGWTPTKPLDFTGVGVTNEDPGDIEYRYLVDCADIGPSGLPRVVCISLPDEEMPIPDYEPHPKAEREMRDTGRPPMRPDFVIGF